MQRFSFLVKVFIMTVCLLCGVAIGSASLTHAATTYVKEGASGAGTSWADATGDLRGVLDAATTGDVIWVASGTYMPVPAGQPGTRSDTFELRSNIKLYGGFPNTGSPSWGDRDHYAYRTELSGEILNPGTADAANAKRSLALKANSSIRTTTGL